MTIPVARPQLHDDEIAAAVRVLRSGSLCQGAEVAAFEDAFSAFVDGRTCVAVNSGTSALWLSLRAAGIGAGDEVIVPAFTSGAAAALTGATPVFADIDPTTYCIDPQAITAAISPRTAAVIPVHLYGRVADMGRITALADRHHLAVVEDAAQAHAARHCGQPAGTFGLAAAFSFHLSSTSAQLTRGDGR